MSETVMDSVPCPGQESWKFIDELKQPEVYRFRYSGRCAKPDEADLGKGVCIRCGFPETKGRLQTAYNDLQTFLRAASIPEVMLPEAMLNTAYEAKTYTWTAVPEKEQLKLCIRLRGCAKDDQLFVTLSGGTECRPLCFELNRNGVHQQNCPAFSHTSTETAEEWRVELTLPVPELHSRNGILHLSLIRLMRGDCPVLIDCSPIAENAGRKRIQLGFYHPGQMYRINLRSK